MTQSIDATAQPGDDVYLGSMLTRLHLWGIVSDLDTPALMSGSLEVLGDEAAMTLDALVGPRGPAGANAPLVQIQWHANITDPSALPTNLGSAQAGYAYWIGNQLYVWSGFNYQIHAMGSTGPAGPVPRISPTFEVVDGPTQVDVTGTTTAPSWHMHVNREEIKGPPGPSAAIFNAADYDNSQPMEAGKVLTCVPGDVVGNFKWGPREFFGRHAKMYTVPEGAFTSFMGLTQRHVILAYQVEPQPYDWIPFVSGHIKALGLMDVASQTIGVEVRVGEAIGGQLIGRGHGSLIGWNAITPHFSTPGDPNVASSPKNAIGMVPAGQVGEIFVSLVHDGLLGLYIFNNNGAQLTILTIPTEWAMS